MDCSYNVAPYFRYTEEKSKWRPQARRQIRKRLFPPGVFAHLRYRFAALFWTVFQFKVSVGFIPWIGPRRLLEPNPPLRCGDLASLPLFAHPPARDLYPTRNRIVPPANPAPEGLHYHTGAIKVRSAPTQSRRMNVAPRRDPTRKPPGIATSSDPHACSMSVSVQAS